MMITRAMDSTSRKASRVAMMARKMSASGGRSRSATSSMATSGPSATNDSTL
jgi:hypothetical protein